MINERVCLLILMLLFNTPQDASAYIDPGTGSFLLQVAVGFLFGGLYFLKLRWRKIVDFFRSRRRMEKQHES